MQLCMYCSAQYPVSTFLYFSGNIEANGFLRSFIGTGLLTIGVKDGGGISFVSSSVPGSVLISCSEKQIRKSIMNFKHFKSKLEIGRQF